METSNAKKIKVGLFIVAGFVMFVVAIFVLGGKDNLFTPTFNLKSEFESVAGLKSGSSVRLNGIVVGKVDGVDIETSQKVLVSMTLEQSIQKFVKKDSKVTIGSDGLVGNKVIDITPGTPGAPEIMDGEMLASIKPVEVSDIMNSLKESGDNAADVTKDLAEIIGKVNSGQGTLGQLVNNDTLYRSIDTTFRSFANYSGQLNIVFGKITNTVDNVSGDLDQLTNEINKITKDVSEIVRKMNSSESIVGTLLTDTAFANNLKELMLNANMTTQNLENGTFSFAQNMEALKHNFLFKGYFEDIGYWEKSDWERNVDKKALELRIKEQELLKKEKELRDLEQRLKLEQKLIKE
ncbi:MAG: MCE family protein [Ignavibacteria bacterium]|nr:MCE family protein [Ignavibacteria bacterium]